MPTPASDRSYHVVRFQDGAEAESFVRVLQQFLSGPRGEAWATRFHVTEVWAPCPLAEGPRELYLSDSALVATEAALTSVSIDAACRGDELARDCVLVLKGANLQ
jgi:hypothetical protein